MSLLTTTHLMYLYDRVTTHDIEFVASAFWQHYIATQFPPQDYMVSHEWSPDGNERKRVDIAVRRLYQYGDEATLMMIECKRKGTSEFKKLEGQLRDYATSYFTAYPHIPNLAVIATWGVRARAFRATMGRRGAELTVLWGTQEDNDKSWYLDAGSEWAWYIQRAVNEVKGLAPPPKPACVVELEAEVTASSAAPK
ncbi:hypothetical protein HJFPF1_13502 [Paramyrothecium foliicola]|nr:hypothetical protein HJFPF1_13613 [Paramyrothecium foliicola]KAI9146764.1 hypothetical protein HJFPF1_13502 [Paramyrothecium foliicola]